jgi:NAD(P)-dependent dehydrogenase (short-subunit alcohol dehydrogenase family)
VNNPRDDNPLDHDGQVVLVTGGTKGIGRGIVDAYRRAGATVVVCGRRAPEVDADAGERADADADAGIDERGEGGDAPTFLPCDVREPEQVAALVDAVVERFGRLDVAVNNAGGAPWADSATASARFNEKVIALNLLAPFTVAQAANRVMQDQADGGSIVNIASVSGVRPSPGTAAYGAAKAGLLNLTETLAVEWAPKVRVNAVVAGLIATEQAHLHYGDDAAIARVSATVPAGRLGTPGDIAGACLFLSSRLAPFVSGAALRVHGGNERPAYLGAVADDR